MNQLLGQYIFIEKISSELQRTITGSFIVFSSWFSNRYEHCVRSSDIKGKWRLTMNSWYSPDHLKKVYPNQTIPQESQENCHWLWTLLAHSMTQFSKKRKNRILQFVDDLTTDNWLNFYGQSTVLLTRSPLPILLVIYFIYFNKYHWQGGGFCKCSTLILIHVNNAFDLSGLSLHYVIMFYFTATFKYKDPKGRFGLEQSRWVIHVRGVSL